MAVCAGRTPKSRLFKKSKKNIKTNPVCVVEKNVKTKNGSLSKYVKLEELSSLMSSVDDIYSAYHRTFIKTIDDQLYGSGYNYCNALGLETNQEKYYTFTKIPLTNQSDDKGQIVEFVTIGFEHTFFAVYDPIKKEKNIMGIGSNTFGQTGSTKIIEQTSLECIQFDELSRKDCIIKVESGQRHSLFLSQNGQVFSCGNNQQGQCGFEIVFYAI